MRELTKSMLRFSWAMPLLAARQAANMALPGDLKQPFQPATETFNALSDAAQQQLGSEMQGIYETGDQVQKGMMDTMWNMVPNDMMSNPMGMLSEPMRMMSNPMAMVSDPMRMLSEPIRLMTEPMRMFGGKKSS